MDAWLIEVISAIAPTVGREIIRVYDKIKTLKDDEQYRIISILLLAQLSEQNHIMNQKLDAIDRKINNANEGILVLLERTKKA
ncbi:MAG: hypothetical protein MRT15_03915 [archaeon YNP-LCB-003-016]|uniref:hypothetical protein n=1 Tax=Candidatus Culexarchaeum yellowstonense TaxID=2928963 RepID=UPI0026EBE017|nr:hypothetical protein [Candidatus Culexarchaeum yellowstonense]MCR6691514.1 hypothetical protein [Candidatus Culexarchaeum yellowstonense]